MNAWTVLAKIVELFASLGAGFLLFFVRRCFSGNGRAVPSGRKSRKCRTAADNTG